MYLSGQREMLSRTDCMKEIYQHQQKIYTRKNVLFDWLQGGSLFFASMYKNASIAKEIDLYIG